MQNCQNVRMTAGRGQGQSLVPLCTRGGVSPSVSHTVAVAVSLWMNTNGCG